MRRQLMIGMVGGVAAVITITFLVVASQQGMFGGKAKRLLDRATQAKQQDNPSEAQAHLEELIATFPDSPWTDEALFELGDVYEVQQQLIEARVMYQMLLEQFPESPLLPQTQKRLGTVNIALLFSPIVTERDRVHEVQSGDTLGQIAASNHTTVACIKRANGLKSDLILPQQRLKVPGGRFSIVVDKSQNQLLLTENEQFVKAYTVATGKDNSTPVGTFTVVNRLLDPVWYTQGAVVPPDSPENIPGTRWLGISEQGYGIHGSIDPTTIGKQVTAGCIRMTNSDVEELFDIVPVGTEVTIVD